jgi:hypothetical protein
MSIVTFGLLCPALRTIERRTSYQAHSQAHRNIPTDAVVLRFLIFPPGPGQVLVHAPFTTGPYLFHHLPLRHLTHEQMLQRAG